MVIHTLADAAQNRLEIEKKNIPLSAVRAEAEAIAAAEKRDRASMNLHTVQTGQQGMAARAVKFPFEEALRSPGMSFICEVKQVEPMDGLIARNVPHTEVALEYEAAGADAIAVFTEPSQYLGSKENFAAITKAVSVPVLQMDLFIDEYMIYQAKNLGASAILLIESLLSDEQIGEYIDLADSLGLSTMVEGHNEWEIRRAANSDADIIAVNNRDPQHGDTDVARSLDMRGLVPPGRLFVSMSGLDSAEDIAKLCKAGADAVLIGESLMTSSDKVKE